MPEGYVSPVDVVKRAALDAIDAGKPVNVLFGTVTAEKPLQIQIDQKITLGRRQLILSRNVTDYTLFMAMEHTTEETGGGSGEAAFASHGHPYRGVKSFAVKNALREGERVILLRLQGGQKFLVIDRLEVSI